MNRYESTKKLSAKDLDDDNDCPNDQEGWVGQDAIENVQLVIDLSGADHIEDLHEDEQVEDNSQMPRGRNTFECFVHRSLFRVLKHTHEHIELSVVPLIL